jgi:non-specific protein-tyrosine kinase
MAALAAAGYRAVAPDQRGFGESDAPQEIEQYSIAYTVGDMVGLVGALGEKQAVIVGHDWGAPVAWTAAQLRPDLFRAVAAMSVPFFARGPKAPTQGLRDAGITRYYWQYFQTPGVAEAELEADPDFSLRAILYGRDVTLMLKPDCGFLGENLPLKPKPAWLSEEDISTVAAAYRHSGFRGGLNWYRNIDRNWGLSGAWDGLTIRQPALFITGTDDILLRSNPRLRTVIDKMSETVPGLRRTLFIDGAGHWIQRERAAEVSDALIAFLKETG